MQPTVVMLMLLGGLGCQNPVSDLPPVLPDVSYSAPQPSGNVSSNTPTPMPYPVYSGGPFNAGDADDDDSFGRCARNTFCSFFIGRDPGVPTAKEIEAAYCAGLYSR